MLKCRIEIQEDDFGRDAFRLPVDLRVNVLGGRIPRHIDGPLTHGFHEFLVGHLHEANSPDRGDAIEIGLVSFQDQLS